MTNLITEARELCEKANDIRHMLKNRRNTQTWKMSSNEALELEFAIDLIPELCDALEKAERESGCEWCKALSFNPDIGGCQLVFFKSKKHPKGEHAISVSVCDEYGEEQEPVLVQIDNCIRCGRRLEVEHGE